MDESIVNKADIDEKLQREMRNLSNLKASLMKSNQMTENMLTILSNFDGRLRKLEDTIVPVYNETGNLQRRQENVEKTLQSLDNAINFYHIAREVDNDIREGPSAGLEHYLECMEKLQGAMDYFKINNPASPEMSTATTLFEAGKDSLEREFKDILQQYSKPVPAIALLNKLSETEEEKSEDESLKLETLSQDVIEDLSTISKWLTTKGNSYDFMNAYAQIRSGVVTRSLEVLKDHGKTGSGGSGTFNMPLSPAVGNKPRTPQKPIPARRESRKNRFAEFGSRKGSIATIKQQFHGFKMEAGMAMGHKRTVSGQPTDVAKDEIPEIEVEVYVVTASALLKLLQSEASLMTEIIPEKHQRKIFDVLVQPGLKVLTNDGENISSLAKWATGRHDFSAILSVCHVLKHLRTIKPDFDITLEGCSAPTRQLLTSLVTTLNSTGSKALQDFIDTIKNDPDKSYNLPKDGTVHELTSNTVNFLEQLAEYSDTVGAMLMTQGADPSARQDNKHSKKLAEYMTKVLSALGLNMSNKSEVYTDQSLGAIFMLNNYNYILKSMKKSGLLSVVHLWNPDVEKYYDDQIVEQKRRYSQSWSRVLHYVMEGFKPISQQKTESPASVHMKDFLRGVELKDKDRQ
ncbi:unnamed protein product, partial [Owenia fusiformis]